MEGIIPFTICCFSLYYFLFLLLSLWYFSDFWGINYSLSTEQDFLQVGLLDLPILGMCLKRYCINSFFQLKIDLGYYLNFKNQNLNDKKLSQI